MKRGLPKYERTGLLVDTKGKLAPKYVRGFVKIGNMKQGHVNPGKFDGSLQKKLVFCR